MSASFVSLFLATVLVTGACYLAVSFAAGTFNLLEWHIGFRIAGAVVGLWVFYRCMKMLSDLMSIHLKEK